VSAAELTVTHSGSGVVFEDDFESDTVGSVPVIGAGDTGGSWIINSSAEVVVTDGPTESITAADQFLKVQNFNGAAVGIAQGRFGSTLSTGSLSAEFSAYIPDTGTNHSLNTSFENSGGTTESWTQLVTLNFAIAEAGLADPGDVGPGEGTLIFYNGSWNYATSGGATLTFDLAQWADVEMNYDLDTLALSFTIDGKTSDNVDAFDLLGGSPNTPSGDAVGIYFRQGSGQFGPNLAYVGGEFGAPLVPGDVDGDGNADLIDFNLIQTNYGMTSPTFADGDLTLDGVIDLFDFKDWKVNRTDLVGAAVSIPEPISLVLLAMGVGALSAASRRRTCR